MQRERERERERDPDGKLNGYSRVLLVGEDLIMTQVEFGEGERHRRRRVGPGAMKVGGRETKCWVLLENYFNKLKCKNHL